MQQHLDQVRDIDARLKLVEGILARIQTGGYVRMTRLVGVLQANQGGTGVPAGDPSGTFGVTVWENQTGATIPQGSVVRYNGSREMALTDEDDLETVIGVMDGSSNSGAGDVPDGGFGRVRHIGYQETMLVETGAGIGAGSFLASGTTPGVARNYGNVPGPGAFAIALTTEASGVVAAYVFPVLRSDPDLSLTYETTDDSPNVANTIEIPAETTVLVEATVAARRTGGTAGTAEDAGAWLLAATVKNVAGVATIVGSVSVIHGEADQAWTATIVSSGADSVYVEITGAVDNIVAWRVITSTFSISN